jgi:hypothetical protein
VAVGLGKRAGHLDQAGHAGSALVEISLHPAMGRFAEAVGRGSVVAAIEEERVLLQSRTGEVLSQGSDGAVHRRDLRVTLAQDVAERTGRLAAGFVGRQFDHFVRVLRGELIVEREILRQPLVGLVRRTEPDHGEEGFALYFGPVEEADRFVNKDGRALAREDFGRSAVAGEGGIQLEEVVVGKAFVETHRERAHRRLLLHRADVPLPEMPAAITGLRRKMSDRDLFGTKGPARREGAHARGMTAGEETRPRRRTTRMGRVKPIEPQSRRCHLVEDRGFDVGMSVVAGLLPAMVVAHHEDEVGERFRGMEDDREKKQEG